MKLIKKMILLLVIIWLLVFGFPKFGVYAFLFDNKIYDEVTDNPKEIINDLDQLSPHTEKLAREFLKRCDEKGLAVKITETYRTQNRQDYLYAQGRAYEGLVVTWTKNSKHTMRRAFDIAKKGNDPYGDDKFFEQCAKIGKEIGLTPGYYFEEHQDKPHFELNRWWLP
ncbi:MAG: M15 family metallopeptidase [Tissierellia bacterium]|nr:M15 family metallopeptidase [Tissierellia bacterium]